MDDYVEAGFLPSLAGPVFYKSSTTSTMEDAKTLSQKGLTRFVVRTDHQSQGIGRFSNRKWVSNTDDALLFTLVLPWSLDPHRPPGLLCALGILDCIGDYGLKAKIKWPNDILIGGRKAAGILAKIHGHSLHLGVGINLRTPESSKDFRTPPTSLEDSGLSIRSEDLLPPICGAILRRLEHGALRPAEVNGVLYGLGEQSSWTTGWDENKLSKGVVQGVGEQGQLILETEAGKHELFSGEGFTRIR